MKLRIQFSKHGSMKFIGHLDTMRYFQKAIRRSGIDIAYTGGFSPHQIMTFAHPLGVGIESDSEIMDIETVSYALLTGAYSDISDNRSRLMRALNDQMSEGFGIRDIRLLPDDTGNAMASVAAASYSVRLRDETYTDEDIEYAVGRFCMAESVEILKKTKKSEQRIDIRPHIYVLSYEDKTINMCVDASSAGNVKPEAVTDAMFDLAGMAPFTLRPDIIRREIFGRTRDGALKPLIEFGTDF